MGLRVQPNRDRCPRGTEIHRVIDQLVEHLDDQIGRPLDLDGLRGEIGDEVTLGKSVLVGADRRSDDGDYVKPGAFCTGDGFFDTRGGSHGDEDGVEALAALPSAVQVDVGALGDALRLEVFQG